MCSVNVTHLHVAVALAISFLLGCEQSPVAESSDAKKFHGTWLLVNGQYDSTKISFDSNSLRFLEQVGYEYGFHREFAGRFTVSNTTLTLNYDYGSTSSWPYRFNLNEFVLGGDGPGAYPWHYIQIDFLPQFNGWSPKWPVLSEQSYIFQLNQVYGSTFSDSATIVLSLNHQNESELVGLKPGSSISFLQSARGYRAVDFEGLYLWLATDSTIVKRTISDTTILASFPYRRTLDSAYRATGLAVASQYCYVMVVQPASPHAFLLKFTVDGALLNSVQTSVVLKDLCLVGDRLFAATGQEMFIELNPTTGQVIRNYELSGHSFGTNINGIAFTGESLQLAIHSSNGTLRLSNTDVSNFYQ